MKLKLRKIGNSQGVYLPLTLLGGAKIGDMIDVITSNVITSKKTKNVITFPDVITSKPEPFQSYFK